MDYTHTQTHTHIYIYIVGLVVGDTNTVLPYHQNALPLVSSSWNAWHYYLSRQTIQYVNFWIQLDIKFSQSKQTAFVLKLVEMSSENRDIMAIICN